MNFLCTCCKQRITLNKQYRHFLEGARIHDLAYHMEWPVFDDEELAKPVTERKWSDRNIQPQAGDMRILRVKKPFDEAPGAVFTNIYEPWQMFYNGWESAESPADIGEACAVLCRFGEVLWADDFTAYITVEILHTVPLCRLHEVIPETVTDRKFFEDFGFGAAETEYADAHLLCRSWSAQGDLGDMQLIYTDDGGRRHELLAGSFSGHSGLTYVLGNEVNA